MTSAVIRQEHRQQQTLTPRLQQAVRLLQLSSLDFAQEVQQAMGTNPFLEVDEIDNEDAANEDAADRQSSAAAEAPSPVPVDAQIASSADAGADSQQDQPWDSERWSQTSSRHNGSGDSDFDLADITPADVSLREHLRSQLYLLPSSDRDRAVMNTIVEAIDDDGYLRVDLQEV
ncbi:MAG: RNA polymerase factor sigma-54, partial [Burkholderiaceae bacterium]